MKSECLAQRAWSDSGSCRGSPVIRGSRPPGWQRASDRRARPTGPSPRGVWRLRFPNRSATSSSTACVPGRGPKVVFSGLDASVAGDIEAAFAAAGHIVVSNARNYRMDPLVPLLIPEVNADHLAILRRTARRQRLARRHRHQSELLDGGAGDGAGAASPVRRARGRRVDDAGGLWRGLSRRSVTRHSGQRRPVHRRRRREDAKRDAEDPRQRRRSCAALGDGERPHQSRRRARWPHHDDLGRSHGEAADRGRLHRRFATSAAGRRSSICPPRPSRRSS